MNLRELVTAVRFTIGSGSAGIELTDGEIEQALNSGMVGINRYFPREQVVTHVWTENITDESVTITHGTAISLANKPIEFETETVTKSPTDGTIYVKDTDYEMDYINGTITSLASGSMTNSTAHLIDYERDPVMLDYVSLLTEPINLQSVDIRSGPEPIRSLEGWELWGDFLIVNAAGSRRNFSDNDHINIYYNAMHTEPTISTSGSFPRFLDELLIVGASGYALLMEAAARRHQATVDLASNRTSIGRIATIHISIGTERVSLGIPQADINVALDRVSGLMTTAAGHNTSAASELAIANTELDKYNSGATAPLDLAETHIASAITALTNVTTILDQVDTFVTDAAGSAEEALNQIDLELDKMVIAGTQAIAELASVATSNAALYLSDGDAFLNAITNSPDASAQFLAYANAKIALSSAYINEGGLRAAFTAARVAESNERIKQATAIIAEASQRLSQAGTLASIAITSLSVADRHISAGTSYTGIANGYVAVASSTISEALTFIQEAQRRTDEVGTYLADIINLLAQINAYLAEADRYQTTADREIVIADSLHTQAIEYLRSYFLALQDRQSRVRRSSLSATPYPSFNASRGGRTLTGSEGT